MCERRHGEGERRRDDRVLLTRSTYRRESNPSSLMISLPAVMFVRTWRQLEEGEPACKTMLHPPEIHFYSWGCSLNRFDTCSNPLRPPGEGMFFRKHWPSSMPPGVYVMWPPGVYVMWPPGVYVMWPPGVYRMWITLWLLWQTSRKFKLIHTSTILFPFLSMPLFLYLHLSLPSSLTSSPSLFPPFSFPLCPSLLPPLSLSLSLSLVDVMDDWTAES